VVGRWRKENLTARRGGLFSLVVEGTLEAFARFGRETTRSGFGQFIGMVMRSVAQESDLFTVAAAPFAKQEMEPQPNPSW
jgi:hypothetical protein